MSVEMQKAEIVLSPYILQTLFHVSVLQSNSAGPFSHDSQLETVCRSNCLYSIKAYVAVEVTAYDMITRLAFCQYSLQPFSWDPIGFSMEGGRVEELYMDSVSHWGPATS